MKSPFIYGLILILFLVGIYFYKYPQYDRAQGQDIGPYPSKEDRLPPHLNKKNSQISPDVKAKKL